MKFDSGKFSFADTEPAVAIIEVGVNHNGSMDIAKELVRKTKASGAQIVKFQAFVAEEEISKFAEKAEYQKETTGEQGGQLEMAKALELSPAQLKEIRQYCWDQEMPFLCSVFDYVSLDLLVNDMKLPTLKIPSSEITNHPFLAEIAKRGVDMILSTGASTLEEVAAAMKVIRDAGDVEIVLLHCVSNYPADISQVNLSAMNTLKNELKVPVGFSDHTEGFEVPIIAAAMGAVAIEKHFTLDKNMQGPDHRASINPIELNAMVRGMRMAFESRGHGRKEVADCEKDNRPLIRKSIVAIKNLPKGHVITKADIGYKRPNVGLHPYEVDKILGKRIKRAFQVDEPILLQDLEQ